MAPVLYSFRRCPYAMRARLALQAAARTVELREIELKAKPQELLDASPKATVPVLVLPDGVLEQSLEIMIWALRLNDPMQWLPKSESSMAEVMSLIADNDGNFKHHLDRYKYPHRYQLDSGLTDRDAGAEFLASLNQRLSQRPYLCSESWGLADAALAPFIRQFAHTDKHWFGTQNWPLLQQWLASFEASDSFNAVMKKFAPWKPGEPPLLTCFSD